MKCENACRQWKEKIIWSLKNCGHIFEVYEMIKYMSTGKKKRHYNLLSIQGAKYHLYDFTRRYLGRFQIEWSYI